MRQLADTLERGATADIWYDFAGWRDYADPEETERGLRAVDRTQAAMTQAAALLRRLADPTRDLTATELAVLRGMLP
jgi:hypothetical protein